MTTVQPPDTVTALVLGPRTTIAAIENRTLGLSPGKEQLAYWTSASFRGRRFRPRGAQELLVTSFRVGGSTPLLKLEEDTLALLEMTHPARYIVLTLYADGAAHYIPFTPLPIPD